MQEPSLGMHGLLWFVLVSWHKAEKKILLVTDAQSTILATDVQVKGQAI